MTVFIHPPFWASDRYGPPPQMRWAATLVTPSAPVMTVAEAKLHARESMTDEDALVKEWIRTAQTQVEQDTDLKLSTQTWDLASDAVPSWSDTLSLPFGPLQNDAAATPSTAVLVKYYDSTPTLQTLASSNYVVDTMSIPGRIGLADAGSWPSDWRAFQPLLIRAVFGWTSPTLIPAPLLHAMRLLIGHYSEERQAVNVGNLVTVIPLGYEALIAPYRLCALA